MPVSLLLTSSCQCGCRIYRAILLAPLRLGSARNPHVLCVRSGCCALAARKGSATITPWAVR
ncbi:hypothetical protein BSR02_18510 [Serratia liquefaciens]|nr:hypothetical protein BSR00_21870 [Serratia liquefaciens]RYM77636.1 hypothetical protein BSR01_17440 [Serratia liquefaciens]RYM83128.1 hypothetical protein BSR02_18510 [Serratia liquefaciens]